jgi:hypothetical protein
MELPIRIDQFWVEWFKYNPTGNLGTDEFCQPGCTAARRTSDNEVIVKVSVRVTIDTAAKDLNYLTLYFLKIIFRESPTAVNFVHRLFW